MALGRKLVALSFSLLVVGWACLIFGRLSYRDYARIFGRVLQSSENNAQSKSNENKDSSSPPKLLLISYDGFRWDYLKRAKAPNLKWLIQNGVHATEGLKNTFITITAPNHYGIVTGLYEESHGIVANTFFDPVLNKTFDYFTTNWKTDPRFFRHAEPIWVTNDNSGDERRTGCVMWVGCDVPIRNHMPQFWLSWNGSIPWVERVDKVISWFLHPKHPVNLGILYIEEPDETGHAFGPYAAPTIEAVEKLDVLTAYLMWSLYRTGLMDKVTLIFTADHGMADVPYNQFLYIDDYINNTWYTVYGGSPNWNVMPEEGKEDLIYQRLKNVSHMSVYKKADLPVEYHYSNTPGVMPLSFFTDEHWGIDHNNRSSETSKTGLQNNRHREFANVTGRYRTVRLRGRDRTFKVESANGSWGEHGYNNSLPDMHPYFIGYGPAFKRGFNVTQFMNLDLYPLMCYILGIETPRPNNGSFERVRSLLADEGARWPIKSSHVTKSASLFDSWRYRAIASLYPQLSTELDSDKNKNQFDADETGSEGSERSSRGFWDLVSLRYGLYEDMVFIFLMLLVWAIALNYLHRHFMAKPSRTTSLPPPPYDMDTINNTHTVVIH